MIRNEQKQVRTAAREVTAAMTQVHSGILRVAEATGLLLALTDNADRVETLSSMRSDQCFQLVGQLHRAYDDLAGFLHDAYK